MSSFEADLRRLLSEDHGLPGPFFTDASAFELERRMIFEGSWVCLGPASDVPARGDLCPVEFLGRPLLMVRDGGRVRVFANACSHRGALLVDKPCRGRARIVCPYHSWAYSLRGELLATPHVGGFERHECPGLVAAAHHLRELRSAEWVGHVFVDASGRAPPFAEWIRGADARLNASAWTEMHRDAELSQTFEVAANWKVIVENFAESYHLPWVHRALNQLNPMGRHYQILGGHAYVGQGSRAYEGEKVAGTSLPLCAGRSDHSTYEALAVFPNLIVVPLPDMLFTIHVTPIEAGSSVERLEFFFWSEAALDPALTAARRRSAQFAVDVNAEDIRIVESVQRGRRSPEFSGGFFSPAQEETSLHFQKMIAARLLATASTRPEDVVALPTRDVPHPAT